VIEYHNLSTHPLHGGVEEHNIRDRIDTGFCITANLSSFDNGHDPNVARATILGVSIHLVLAFASTKTAPSN
jgi:hypothetical protein